MSDKARAVVTIEDDDEIVIHMRCSRRAGEQLCAFLGPTSGDADGDWAYQLYNKLCDTVGRKNGLVEYPQKGSAWFVKP